MNNIIKISSIIIYLIFTQVWSVVHLHADERHGEIEIRLSVHPPDLPIDDHDHEDHHDKSEEHEHTDTHFVGDCDYTFRINTFNFESAPPLLIGVSSLIPKSQVLDRTPQDIPLKITQHYLQIAIPNRAPPQIA
jgi:hypothetical protein